MRQVESPMQIIDCQVKENSKLRLIQFRDFLKIAGPSPESGNTIASQTAVE
jgi:hypothetical protein